MNSDGPHPGYWLGIEDTGCLVTYEFPWPWLGQAIEWQLIRFESELDHNISVKNQSIQFSGWETRSIAAHSSCYTDVLLAVRDGRGGGTVL